MKRTSVVLLATLVGSSIALSGCGDSSPSPAAKTPTPAAAPAATTPATGRAIEITANDTMKFNLVEIRAKAGEALSVTLVNVGTMPKFSMGHNWVLLAADTDVAAFIAAAAEAPTKDYRPDAFAAKILASTKLLGPRERDTVTFEAPAQPGSYPFLCSFPGHYQVGMKGQLIVE